MSDIFESGGTAVITGAASGIGRAAARRFAERGMRLCLFDVSEEALKAVASELSAETRIVAGDVSRPEDLALLHETAYGAFGTVTVLMNNAGTGADSSFTSGLDQWHRIIDVNLWGVIQGVNRFMPSMLAQNCRCAIINTGSITGLDGSQQLLDYSATKGAIHAFTKSLAQNLVQRGIRVNCVAPGPVWTPLNPSDRPAEDVANFGKQTPYGRPAQPEEMAPAYVFFASNADSSYVTGEVLTLLGGSTTAG
jgi:NAD(P)-dependent dehydrogenase (short-subunit alcohol dehydrogenase family)